MSKKIRYVPNRKATQELVLRSPKLTDAIVAAAEAAAPEGTEVSTFEGKTRTRVTIYDESPRALSREAREGHLSRALGQVHL